MRPRAATSPAAAAPTSTCAGSRPTAEAHPDREWIVGGGWSMSDFPGGIPTAAALDAVVSDRPVVLTNRDYHGAWVNSRALELAGITAATPDPPGGRIERDAAGAPVGMLQEQAMHLVLDRAPAPTHADRVDGIRAAEDYYFRLGHHRLPGRPGRRRVAGGLRAARPRRRAAAAGARGARVAARRRRAPARRARRAPRERHRRPARVRQRQVLPRRRGREPHGGDARPLPRRRRPRRPPSTASTSIRRRRSSGSCACATPRASACTSTPSATAPCASRWTCSRPRSARTGAATPATSWRTSSSPTPTICPASARSA